MWYITILTHDTTLLQVLENAVKDPASTDTSSNDDRIDLTNDHPTASKSGGCCK